jgi:hypothetical protein
MRRAGPFLLAAMAALAACADPAPPPSPAAAATAPVTGAATPPRTTGPVNSFDGRYAGTLTLNPDRTRACPPAPQGEREITVRNGRATFVVNPQIRQTQTGTVGAEGSVRMMDSLDRNIATTGMFTEDWFRGEYRNGLCSYAVQMPKRN